MRFGKILLVDPRGPGYGINISLASLGTHCNNNGIATRILDLNNVRDNAEARLSKAIESYKPDLIGLSVMYITFNETKKTIEKIRELTNCPVIVGGPQIHIETKDVLDSLHCDFALRGEAETALLDLCNGDPFSTIKGLIFRNTDGSVIDNGTSEKYKNVDQLPIPDYSLMGIKKITTYPILTSRGCPYSCKFCFRPYEHDWRFRTPENIIAELRIAKDKYDIQDFIVLDDTFNMNKDRAISLCESLVENKINLPWCAVGIRADHVTDELASAMRKSGCTRVGMGAESFDPDVFEGISKRESPDEITKAIHILRKNSMEVRANFIIGLPGDTYEKTMATYKKACKLKLYPQSWTIFMPLPKTEFYTKLFGEMKLRQLADYKETDMIWAPWLSNFQPTFELPEFPAKKKLFAYFKINTLLGNTFLNVDAGILKMIFQLVGNTIRYAGLKSPIVFFLIFRKYFLRILHRDRVLVKALNTGLEFTEQF
jgi:anaerobic magnesium-protoporphyrin IX monomethyl ester cyclase